jgi:hypothetical protein
MRQTKLIGNQPPGLSHFLFPLSITFGVGLVILLLYTRSSDRKVANATASSIEDKQACSQLIATRTTDDQPPQTAASLTDPASNDSFDGDKSGIEVAATEQLPDQGISHEDAAANRRILDTRWSDPTTAKYAAASTNNLAPGFAESGASIANPQVRSAGSSPSSLTAPVSLPDPDAVPFNYPPRRIPWHQGFSVEQQWNRAWYGWGSSETP